MNLLQNEWEERLKLYAEAHELDVKGGELSREAIRLHVEVDKLFREEGSTAVGEIGAANADKVAAKSSQLQGKANELYAKANELWAEAILKAYGNRKLKWKNPNKEYRSHECHLENGEVYGF